MRTTVKRRNFAKAKVTTILQSLHPLHINYLFIIHPSHFILEKKNKESILSIFMKFPFAGQQERW